MNLDLNYHRLLLIEDDVRLSNLIGEYLQKHGFEVEFEYRGDKAIDRIITSLPDLVILDLMLPGLDGLEICRRVRSDYAGPILMLTAQDEDVDQIVGLEIGADDYVVKPVEPRVLLARIKTLLRRVYTSEKIGSGKQTQIIGHGFSIDSSSREVVLNAEKVKLTTSEFDLLWFLASHAGVIISREDLYQGLSGIEYDGLDRSMDIRISKLRKLLHDDSEHPTLIKTVRGQGYLFTLNLAE